jgi:TBC1 domain family protein 5
MPENLYFRQPDTQRMMLDILFVFCKLNPDLGYRQGMHELLAPMLWVVERDAVNLGQSSKAMGEDAVIRAVYDADHIEHDAFALFGQVMQNAKSFYEQTTHAAADNPMVLRSKRIVFDMLSKVDRELSTHLEKLDIMPQIFLMRWVRLLFGREFPFDDVLTMWDVIFANDTSLEIVDHICIAMVLRIRWELMDSDYNNALTLLLRYPPLPRDFAPQSFVLDALYLREHMHAEGGGYLVLKYTDRPLQPGDRPATPPALQRNITAFSGVNAAKAALGRTALTPDGKSRQGRNIESMFQSAAKNITARSEQLGIGKAVRNAVDEVHRKAQEISNAQTPSSSNARRQGAPRTAYGAVLHKVKELENRNAQLNKLLEAAVGDLWEYQKVAAEGSQSAESIATQEEKDSLEKLSVAIAKVQFVQVYLGDASLPLPTEEKTESEQAVKDGHLRPAPTESGHEEKPPRSPSSPEPVQSSSEPELPPIQLQNEPQKLADPSTFDEPDEDSTEAEPQTEQPGTVKVKRRPEIKVNSPPIVSPSQTKPAPAPAEVPLDLPPPPTIRPPLAESSYSWMLGSDNDKNEDKREGKSKDPDITAETTPQKAPSSFFEDQRRNRGFLFGDDTERVEEPALKVVNKKGRAHRKHASLASTKVVTGEAEDVVLGMDDLKN